MSDRAFLGPADTYLENRQIVFAEDYEKLERELAEARIEIGKANVHTAHWQACCSEDTIAQLTAHKAALEKCEGVIRRAKARVGYASFEELNWHDCAHEAISEIAKLTPSDSVNSNQSSQ